MRLNFLNNKKFDIMVDDEVENLPELKPDTYKILSETVEQGIEMGWRRAHKHDDEPSSEMIKGNIHNATMLLVSENFKF